MKFVQGHVSPVNVMLAQAKEEAWDATLDAVQSESFRRWIGGLEHHQHLETRRFASRDGTEDKQPASFVPEQPRLNNAFY